MPLAKQRLRGAETHLAHLFFAMKATERLRKNEIFQKTQFALPLGGAFCKMETLPLAKRHANKCLQYFCRKVNCYFFSNATKKQNVCDNFLQTKTQFAIPLGGAFCKTETLLFAKRHANKCLPKFFFKKATTVFVKRHKKQNVWIIFCKRLTYFFGRIIFSRYKFLLQTQCFCTGEKQVKKINSKTIFNFLKGYFAVTVAGVLNAVSLFTFVNPATLIAGGFSGLASALSHVLVLFVNVPFDKLMSVVYFILNVPLLICSLIFLRGDFTFKTIWATVVSTFVLGILPQDFKFHGATIISVIFGGLLVGVAMYVAYEENGSNGGTEIIGRIVNKYRPEIDISKVILIANFFITLSGSIVTIIVVPDAKIDIILYSFMYVLIGGNVLGMLKRGFDHPQKFLIITTEYKAIGEKISQYYQRGYTCMDLDHSYDGKERKMIVVVVQYRQMYSLKHIIKKCDPNAFTVIKDVYDVFSRPTFNRSYKTK